MRVSIILNETDITIIIIIVMVMIMMEEVAKPVILFTNPLIRITKLKLVKKNNKQEHLEARKLKNKKIK